MPAAGSHQRSFTFTLPEGNAGVGQLAITIGADDLNQVFEFNAGGSGETNNTTSASVASTLAPYADLVVTSLVAPSAVLTSNPAILDVDVTVQNQGDGDVTAGWSDRIYVSADNVVGNADDLLVATFAESGPLAAGASYTRTRHLTLPPSLDGTRYLYAVTDVFNAVKEYRDGVASDNNNASAVAPITLQPLHADLAMQVVTTAASAQSGDPIDVAWRVMQRRHYLHHAQHVERQHLALPRRRAGCRRYAARHLHADQHAAAAGVLHRPAHGHAARRHRRAATTSSCAPIRAMRCSSPTDEANNTGRSVDALAVTLKPFPDLQVSTVSGPVNGQCGQTREHQLYGGQRRQRHRAGLVDRCDLPVGRWHAQQRAARRDRWAYRRPRRRRQL